MLKAKIYASKITSLILVFLLGYTSFLLYQAFSQNKLVHKKIRNLKAEIQAMSSLQARLRQEKDYFQSNDFLEKEARKLLNYQKPGEKVFSVLPPSSNQAPQEIVLETNLNKRISQNQLSSWPNFRKWCYYFFKK